MISPSDSSSSAFETGAGERIIGKNRSAAMIIAVKTRKTDCQVMNVSSHSARGAPTTCPPEPAAVATASANRTVLIARRTTHDC